MKNTNFSRYTIVLLTLCPPPRKFFKLFFHLLIFFFKINCFEKFFWEYHQSVKQFGSRSGLMFCRA